MDDLVQFLRARLDEDEQTARATVPGPWEWTPEDDQWGDCGPTLVHAPGDNESEVLSGWGHDAWGMNVADGAAAHIARHDPARVLREVDAKRRIVDECAYWIGKINKSDTDKYPYPNLAERGEVVLPVLTLLALPYADHPDYRDEWRP